MADHTLIQNVLGACIQNVQKLAAPMDMARDAEVTDSNVSLLTRSGGLAVTDQEEMDMLGQQQALQKETLVPGLRDLIDQVIDSFKDESDLWGILKEELSLLDTELTDTPITFTYTVLATGQRNIKARGGPIGRLYEQMDTDSEDVLENAVAGGSLTNKSSSNNGSLTASTKTGRSSLPAGTMTLKCVSENVEKPEFTVRHDYTTPLWNGETSRVASANLISDVTFEDGELPVTLKIDRSGLAAATETDPDSIFSGVSYTGPKVGDTDKGINYIKVTREASDVWLIEVYNASSRSEDNKVGSDNSVSGTTSTAAVSMTLNNGTVLAFTYDKAAAHTAMAAEGNSKSDIEFDFKTPLLDEEYTIAWTNDEASDAQTGLMNVFGPGSDLPEVASTPTYAEAKFADVLT